MKKQSILELIGDTPIIRVNKLFNENNEIWLKLENQNPGGSIKDRIALAMIEEAENSGLLTRKNIIVEPTSGNTGIGLSLVAAVKGYKLILVMPESMSHERTRQMKAFGAEVVLTPKEKGMNGAIDKAKEISGSVNGWMPLQFKNQANPDIHSQTTAKEILADFPEGIDFLVSGVGTGGHISGTGRELKKHWPLLKIYAVEPLESPVISGGIAGPHAIQGIGAGFIPDNLDTKLLDGVIKIPGAEAFSYAKKAAKQEGIFVGISTGASLAAIAQKQNEWGGKKYYALLMIPANGTYL